MTPSCWSKTSTQFIQRWEPGGDFSYEVLDLRPGFIRFRVKGKHAKKIFSQEIGGHRWQRIPPTEKKGRRQTSTITVACLDESGPISVELNPDDLEIKTTKGSGPGGQNRNKVETAVQILHKPSGELVSVCMGKSQSRNKKNAKRILKNRLEKSKKKSHKKKRDRERRKQVGTGMRSDRTRTIQTKSNTVINHRNGKTIRCKEYMKGFIEELHD